MLQAPALRRVLLPALGGGFGIALMIGLAEVASLPLTLAPFTTSIVLVMAAPHTAYARPRNVIGGHLLSALAGLMVVTVFGDSPWFAALAVGLAIAAMQAGDVMHPPAGINALIMVVAHPPWTFVLLPVLVGALILVTFARLLHRGAGVLAEQTNSPAAAKASPARSADESSV